MTTMAYCPGCKCFRRVEEQGDRLVCIVCKAVCSHADEEPEIQYLGEALSGCAIGMITQQRTLKLFSGINPDLGLQLNGEGHIIVEYE